MDQVNEKSTAYLTVTFRDKAGALAAPSAVSYRVDCASTGAAIRPDTPVTPASSVEIALDPADNTIQSAGSRTEIRVVTVTATYGAADALRSEYRYEVVNLAYAS